MVLGFQINMLAEKNNSGFLTDLEPYVPRMLADGVENADALKIFRNQERINTMGEWCQAWLDIARVYEQLANNSLADGFKLTAGERFWKASLYSHYGQFLLWKNDALKSVAKKRKVENYYRSAPLLEPPATLLEIPFEDGNLPGFIRVPRASTTQQPPPCVLLIGGLESTKEEYYLFENLCLKRGLATFAFDGPGQGEVFAKFKVRADFEKVTSTVIDYLEERIDAIDPDKMGVVGRSLGGYYAARSAAHDERIKACIAWSVFYEFDFWDRMPELLKQGFTYVGWRKNEDEARRYYETSFTLKGHASKITCPLYILQGRKDNTFPAEAAESLAQEVTSSGNRKVKLVIKEEGTHCAHNMADIVRPEMADWMSKTLTLAA